MYLYEKRKKNTKKTRSSENQWRKPFRKKDEITVAIVTVINAKVDY